MNQGGIYEHTVGPSRFRVLVVSSDAHNDTGKLPWVAPLRRGHADLPPYLIALSDLDPVGGSVDLDRMTRVAVVGEPIVLVTGATMNRVREALTTIFAG